MSVTIPEWITGEELVPYVRGAPYLSLQEGRVRVLRLDPSVRAYPSDMWEHAHAAAGVHLVFRTTAAEVLVRLLYEEVRGASQVSLWQGDKRLSTFVPKESGEHTLNFQVTPGPDSYTLYLPYNSVVQIAGLSPVGGLRPAPAYRHSWVAYGDSITHGMQATDPGQTYVASAARTLGVDFVNMGFAGAARGELVVAETLAKTSGDVFSFAFGTNLMRYFWYDQAAWGENFRMFLDLFRHGHPDRPLLVVSPIYRSAADAESTPNPRGMTVGDIRRIEEQVVSAKRKEGDQHLHLLSGLDVLGRDDAHLLADGIHPNDQGMRLFADRLAGALKPLLGR